MGIKGLSKVLNCSTRIKYKDIAGKRLAIDAYPVLYGSSSMQYASGLTNAAGEPTHYIQTIINGIFRRRAYGIGEMWCIDGRPPPEKKETGEERKVIREEAAGKIEVLEREILKLEETMSDMKPEEIRMVDPTYEKTMADKRAQLAVLQSRNPTRSQFNTYVQNLIFILDCLGIPYAMAPDGVDSEKLCAQLARKGVVDIVQTNDFDALPFGSPVTIIKVPGESGVYDMYNLEDCLKKHRLNMTDFREMCVALGSDYAPGCAGCGPVKVWDKIGIFEFDEKQRRALEIFTEEIKEPVREVESKETPESRIKLREWLTKVQGFSPDRLDKFGLVASGEIITPKYSDIKSSATVSSSADAPAKKPRKPRAKGTEESKTKTEKKVRKPRAKKESGKESGKEV